MTRAIAAVLLFAAAAAACQSGHDPSKAGRGSGSGGGTGTGTGSGDKVTRSTGSRRAPPPPLPDPLPGARRDVTALVGAATRAAIGDLDGDGRRELVVVDPARLRVVDPDGRERAAVPVSRGIQALVIADLDADGRGEIYAGWGISREHMDATAGFTVLRLDGAALVEATVLAPTTSRQDAVAIVPMPETRSLLLAYFESKYMVTSVVATPAATGWKTTPVATLRTATSYARGDVDGDGAPDLVVGRVYGDAQGSDGDAFVLAPDGTRTAIPTTRGLRSLALADADGDGRVEVFLGDGWHANYGASAQGLLTWARIDAGQATASLIEETPGQFSVERLVPATIDGGVVIVAMGNAYTRVFRRTAGAWRGLTIAGAARDVAVGELDGAPGDEIVIVGDRSEVVSLAGVTW